MIHEKRRRVEGRESPKDRSQAKAEEFYNKVVVKVRALVQDTLHKWQMAGFEEGP
jgi:hypothetical protein